MAKILKENDVRAIVRIILKEQLEAQKSELEEADLWNPNEADNISAHLNDLKNDPDLMALTKALTSSRSNRASALAKDENQKIVAKIFSSLFGGKKN